MKRGVWAAGALVIALGASCGGSSSNGAAAGEQPANVGDQAVLPSTASTDPGEPSRPDQSPSSPTPALSPTSETTAAPSTPEPTAAPSPTPTPTAEPTPTPTATPEPPTAAELAFLDGVRRNNEVAETESDTDLLRRGLSTCELFAEVGSYRAASNMFRFRDVDGLARSIISSAAEHLCPPPSDGGGTAFIGTGDAVLQLEQAAIDGFALLYATHEGRRNFIVKLLDDTGESVGSVINHIGPYQGTVFAIEDDNIALIQISADGPWTLELAPVTAAPKTDLATAIQGDGDDVIGYDGDGPAIIEFSCPACDANVIVKAYGRGRAIINEIGAYTGTVVVPADTVLLSIQTSSSRNDGDSGWTITPQ